MIIRKKIVASVQLMISACMLVLPSAVSASTISYTGPYSTNSISSNYSSTCNIENDNDVSLHNSTNQNAQSGNISVGGKKVGGDWNDWSPLAWQEHGYTYDQWHSAFMGYMDSNMGSYKSGWGSTGGGVTSVGSLTTGDASNDNSTAVGVHIDNSGSGCQSGSCGCNNPGGGSGGGTTMIDHTGPNSSNKVVLGAKTTYDKSNENDVIADNRARQNADSGDVSINGSTRSGSASSGDPSNGNGTHAVVDIKNQPMTNNPSMSNCGCSGGGNGSSGGNSTISTTGPGSTNEISFQSNVSTKIENDNNVKLLNYVTQNANSGDVSASNSTSVGSLSSGDAANSNYTNTNVTISN